ncbi:MAG: type 4a pilus biogenesis protein PilO [Phycisphaerae bacterium]|jgi:Tfp pilus assembly protein PilO|nr:type 4a pilus biogenesis protein PilO [Phycisphaerae bacterium]
MKIRNLKPLHIDLGALGCFVVMALIAYVLVVHPVIERHKGLDLREAELKTEQRKAQMLSSRVAQIASQITAIDQELSDSAIKLRSVAHINSHLARLTALTGECGLKLDRLRPDKCLTGSRYQTVPIYLFGSGSFPECAKLMHELKRNFPDTSVASFEITGDPTKPKEPTTLRVDLLWYAAGEELTSAGY